MNIIKNDPKASAGQVSFYKELASLSQKNPNMLNCSFIDIFTHQENKHFFDIANSISFDKLKKSNQAFDALKNGHCLLRENFLFQESLSQIKKKHFSKIILLLGGIHIRSKGGTPNGVDFVESLYSRLKKELSIDSINFTFLALSGHHGILKKQNEKIISISQKLPKLDSDMELLKSTIRDFEQSYGLIKSSDIITHQDMNNDFLEWINSYDYILPCKKITPDLNPFSYSVRINF
ncbi:MAG: hypothetical protein KAQ98_05385 [Bacteriovoracaceae bacterium]|nr:hypothetical protein [Bacteriovoracaceae bacterium]